MGQLGRRPSRQWLRNLIVHAAWLPQTEETAACFALWGEAGQSDTLLVRARGRTRDARPHPFAASAEALREALPLPELNEAAVAGSLVAQLPSAGARPLPSRPFLSEPAPAAKIRLGAWTLPALLFTPLDSLTLLINVDIETPGRVAGPDLRFWIAAARFALELVAGQRYLPALITSGTVCRAVWRPQFDLPDDQARFDKLAGAMPPAARAVTRSGAKADPEIGPHTLLTDFLDCAVDAFVRQEAEFTWRRKKKSSMLPGELWLRALVAEDSTVDLPPSFVEQYQAWTQPAQAPEGNFRLCFRLDPPGTADEDGIVLPRPGAFDWTLRYFLQANDDPSLLVPAEAVWRERGSSLKFLNRKFDQPQEGLLAGLGLAARIYPPIEDSLRAARPEGCQLAAEGAHNFIREAALLLQGSGFGVLLPGLSTKLGLRLKLGSRKQTKAPAGGVAKLAFENVVAFNWELALGDQVLTRDEFERLAALKVPLVQVRGQWVEVRPEQLQQALDFLRERETAGEVTLEEALRLALAPGSVAGLPVAAVETAGWVGELLGRLTGQARLEPLAAPAGFVGTLRPYQAVGFAWLAFLRQFGLGACLADDMGLGKTIQTIALLLHLRQAQGRRKKPALLVCPTSVVSNWQHEVERFAPSLRVLVHHGSERDKANFVQDAQRSDLVLTAYALLPRDEALLAAVEWGEVILDEAQNIKNPDTRQARAARQLPAEHRIALTGTPIENRLGELWSLFQFINPGYLGTQASFQTNFARPIERAQDPAAARRLKDLAGPFILRRVKTDRSVIDDLPAKNEMKVYCALTREQATLYEAVVRDSLRQIEQAEGVQRRGLVLSTLMKLKQVCNHPAHLLGDGSALVNRSGKLNRLGEMLDEVREVKEHALIFTQFAEMGELLKRHLEASFGDEVLFLHGGTPAKTRTKLVDRFQNDPYAPPAFILSLKAGGTGLNLTRANHVFHFDRWWNPAVENQATDRAFRIGQTRNVQVYKFLCTGTVEERIDEMIERKLALAQSIVGTSEAWITELSTEQLRDLFALRAEAVV